MQHRLRDSVTRLRDLPVVFSLNRAVRQTGMSRPMLSVYLSRWERSGLVRKAGPKSGVYYNLLVDPKAPELHLTEAIRLLYPSAVLCGASVLHNAGWITQIPRDIHIVVLKRQTYPKLFGVETHPRTKTWFVKHAEDIEPRPKFAAFGLPALSPAASLSDLREYQDGWVPDLDDLDDLDEDLPDSPASQR